MLHPEQNMYKCCPARRLTCLRHADILCSAAALLDGPVRPKDWDTAQSLLSNVHSNTRHHMFLPAAALPRNRRHFAVTLAAHEHGRPAAAHTASSPALCRTAGSQTKKHCVCHSSRLCLSQAG
jgi:hypothetical protein